jgi:4-hydroxybenzoate polyprenyltransferase
VVPGTSLGRAAALIRLRHWAHFLLLPLAGRDATLSVEQSALSILRGVAIAFCLLAFGYLLNSLADRDMDLDIDKRAAGALPPARGRAIVAGLAIAALALALTGPLSVSVATAVCMASGTIYSVGPRLKTLPFVGTALNVGNFGPLLFVGLARDALPPALPVLAAAFVLLLGQNQLLHEAADAEEDVRGGVRTTFRRLGSRGAALLALIAGGLLVPLLHRTPLPAIVGGAAFGLGFPAAFLRLGERPADMARLRLLHRVLALAFGAGLYALGWG